MSVKDRSTLLSDLAVLYPDNSEGLITPAIMRGQQADIIDSYLNFESEIPADVFVTELADLPAAIAGVITLSVAAYHIKGTIDLGTDVLNIPAGALLSGDTTALSGLITNSSTSLITHDTSGSLVIEGGILLDNNGGPILRMNNAGALLFGTGIVSRNGTDFIVVDAGLLASFTSVTVGSPLSGSMESIGLINANSTALVFRGLGINITGDGITLAAGITLGRFEIMDVVQGVSGDTLLNMNATSTVENMLFQNIEHAVSAGNGIEIAGTIDLLNWSSVEITGSLKGLEITGAITQSIFNNLVAIGTTSHGLDIATSTIARIFITQHFLFNVAGAYGFNADAASANISGAATITTGTIIGGLGALNGVSEQDLKYTFKENSSGIGTSLEDSRNAGEVFLTVSATPFTVTGSGAAYTQIGNNGGSDPWTTQLDDRFSVANDGTLTYIGLTPIEVEFAGTAVLEKVGGGSDLVCAAVYINDTVQQTNTIGCTRATSETQVVCLGLTSSSISTNDTFNIWVNNTTGAADVEIYGASLIVKEV